VGTALFFLVAMAALNETRQRRPEAGCGCFGEFSETPVGWRTITRAGLLCAAAAATVGLPPLRMPSSPATAELWLAAAAFELSLLAFLSPELAELLVRLGYSEPCEVRKLPVARTLAALQVPTGAGTRAWFRRPPRLTYGGKDAGGSWCIRARREAGGSISSSPFTSRPAARRSGSR
jgi:hypothetical protein